MSFKADLLARLGWMILIVGLVYGYLRYFEWKNFFHLSTSLAATPADFGLEFEDVQFVAEDGAVLHGWWIPCEHPRGTLIYCHGNAGTIGDRAWMMPDLRELLGVNIFMFDYRGYGKSRGIPTEQGTYRDARAAYEVVRARYGDAEQPPVIVYGHSLGGAVAVQLAVDKPVRGLVVEGSFSSSIDMGMHYYPSLPVSWLLHFKYDSAAKVASLNVPKLFAHGKPDEVVPYALGQKLFEAAAEPKQWVELPGGHDDVAWMTDDAFRRILREFTERILPAQ